MNTEARSPESNAFTAYKSTPFLGGEGGGGVVLRLFLFLSCSSFSFIKHSFSFNFSLLRLLSLCPLYVALNSQSTELFDRDITMHFIERRLRPKYYDTFMVITHFAAG